MAPVLEEAGQSNAGTLGRDKREESATRPEEVGPDNTRAGGNLKWEDDPSASPEECILPWKMGPRNIATGTR